MRQASWALAAFLAVASPLGALGLAKDDSFAGLRAVTPPLRMTWTADAVTAKMMGGNASFADDLGSVAFKRLKEDGVPVVDGEFDPRLAGFVSLDVWVRGVSRAEDPKDPKRVFHFEFQVFAPAQNLPGAAKDRGRVVVWERSYYGVSTTDTVQTHLRKFLALCDDFALDWSSVHYNDAPGSITPSATLGNGAPLAPPQVPPMPGTSGHFSAETSLPGPNSK
jgi:hypothetical protein